MPNHFHGRIEGTNIVIDNCNYKDAVGCYFLISHPHTDHTGGLTETFNKGAIHCSTLCKQLLLMRFPLIQQHNPIIGHDVGTTFKLSNLQSPERRGLKSNSKRIKNRDNITHSSNSNNTDDITETDSEDEWRNAQSNSVQITLIDANHCPGSVMFLIKNTNGKIYLHTGDYRTSNEMIHNTVLTNVWIDIVYMDVTFCHPSLIFPTKNQIAIHLTDYIKQKNKDKIWKKQHNISFKIMYIDAKQLGIEPFLVAICKIFNTKIWANCRSWQYKNLCHFKSTAQYMTLDQNEAMIRIAPNGIGFAAFVKKDRKYRKENRLPNIMYISATTMYFALRNICATPLKYTQNDGITHVLYSMHSDYNEMRKFISKLNVKQVMPFNDPFIPGKGRDTNFSSVSWVRSQFKDCIEGDTTESRDIFVPDLNQSNTKNMNDERNTAISNNRNVHSCVPTSLDQAAQNNKMMRILHKLQQNKHRSSQHIDALKPPPKRVVTAPIPLEYNGMRGAKGQNEWIKKMKQKNNTKQLETRSEHIKKGKRKRSSTDYSTKYMEHKTSPQKSFTVPSQPSKKHRNNNTRDQCIELEHTPLTPITTMSVNGMDLMIGISASSSQSNQSPDLSSCEPNVNGVMRNGGNHRRFDDMDVDHEADAEDNDAKMVMNDEDNRTPGNIGNDDSTINEENESETEGIQDRKRYSVYKTFDNGRKPYFLSRHRVENRNVLLYRVKRWNKNELNGFLSIMDALKLRRVYTIKKAKFIVVDSEMMRNQEIRDEILRKLGLEYKNGCHHVREVYSWKIFKLLPNYNRMRGTQSKQFNGTFGDYLMFSTFDADINYLKGQKLWPLKPTTCYNKLHH